MRRTRAHHRLASATPNAIRRAAAHLRAGRLVAFPTETVYGLGADAGSDRAVAAIYAAKARPRFNPLIVHVLDAAAAAKLVHFDARARRLARRFWPGPLTMVLPRRANAKISWLASAGLDTLGVRVPDHPVAIALLRAARRPLAAPSANRSGKISPTSAGDVARSLGARVAMILDGGPCRVGIESTVLDLTGRRAVLLRPGGVTREALERVIGRIAIAGTSSDAVRSPGQLASHYAPGRPVRLKARRPRPGEAYLAFGAVPRGVPPVALRNLSPKRDLAEAAANLFAFLRALDRPRFAAIAVAPIPERGLGAAINDRLRRAAAPRRSVKK
ncbi:MAG TPA: L-threonylcarbamoyladenylate synthase [Alphaproteobacteria bacterium]|nr:L-threonylcarbamoyladenylate synthase [Alphaproteobacteria bacterium]